MHVSNEYRELFIDVSEPMRVSREDSSERRRHQYKEEKRNTREGEKEIRKFIKSSKSRRLKYA